MTRSTHPLDQNDQKLIAAAKRRTGLSWRSPGGPVQQLPLLFIFLVALLAPADVLERSSLASCIASAGRSGLLQVSDLADLARFADSTAFPQVALLVCALHWLWLPFSACITAVIFEYGRRTDGYVVWRYIRGDDGHIKVADAKLLIGGGLLFLVTAAGMTMTAGDWSLAEGLMTQSRVGMACMLWAAFWILGMFLGLIYPMARTFLAINCRTRQST